MGGVISAGSGRSLTSLLAFPHVTYPHAAFLQVGADQQLAVAVLGVTLGAHDADGLALGDQYQQLREAVLIQLFLPEKVVVG